MNSNAREYADLREGWSKFEYIPRLSGKAIYNVRISTKENGKILKSVKKPFRHFRFWVACQRKLYILFISFLERLFGKSHEKYFGVVDPSEKLFSFGAFVFENGQERHQLY